MYAKEVIDVRVLELKNRGKPKNILSEKRIKFEKVYYRNTETY